MIIRCLYIADVFQMKSSMKDILEMHVYISQVTVAKERIHRIFPWHMLFFWESFHDLETWYEQEVRES